MAKTRKNQGSESTSVDSEARVKLLNEKLAKIENDIAKNQEMDADEATKAMYLAFFGTDSIYNIREMCEKITKMEEKFGVQETYISNLEKRVSELEIESHQSKVILRNIPLKEAKDNKESFNNTKTSIESLLEHSGQSLVSVTDFYRIYPKKISNKNNRGVKALLEPLLQGKNDPKEEKIPMIFI